MTYLSIRTKIDQWRRSLIWSLLSSLLMLTTYLNTSPDMHSAGANFSYNLTFFFPVLSTASIFGFVAVYYLMKFTRGLKSFNISFKIVRIGTIVLLLLPASLHLFPVVLTILLPI